MDNKKNWLYKEMQRYLKYLVYKIKRNKNDKIFGKKINRRNKGNKKHEVK